jgi:UDP-N-acetylmuramate dehydrogenase
MFVQENVPLGGYSTMRLGGPARYLTEVASKQELAEAVAWADERQLPKIMIGEGSNIIWGDAGYPGLVMVSKITGFETFQEDDDNLYVTIGSGEEWDSVVERCVASGFSGVEQLSLIPGTAGGTPVQNVGAYGQEIKNVLVSVEAYDDQAKKLVNIPAIDCAFGYRTSRFKTTDKGRFFITAITLHLVREQPQPPFYSSLQAYFDEHTITQYTPAVVRQAVIAVRTSKLPDPDVVANNGSFFGNPIISADDFAVLQTNHPEVKYWQLDDGRVKISAGWLIEQAGFKGMHDAETGMATWDKQALVLVNEHAKHTADLLKFKQKIVDAVQQKFGVTLEQEPELI